MHAVAWTSLAPHTCPARIARLEDGPRSEVEPRVRSSKREIAQSQRPANKCGIHRRTPTGHRRGEACLVDRTGDPAPLACIIMCTRIPGAVTVGAAARPLRARTPRLAFLGPRRSWKSNRLAR